MEVHLADAIESLVKSSTKSLSEDRSPKDPYRRSEPALAHSESNRRKQKRLRSNCISSSPA